MFSTEYLSRTQTSFFQKFHARIALPLRLVWLPIAFGFALASCSNKPTIEECRTSLANFLRIQLGDSATPAEINRMVTEEPISVRMTKRCVETKTKKQVQCEMSAPNQAELRKCARFAKKN